MTEEKRELVIDDGRIEAVQEHLSPEELYRDLVSRVQKYHPSDDISLRSCCCSVQQQRSRIGGNRGDL